MAAAHIDCVDKIEINKNGIVRVLAVSDGDPVVWKMPLSEYRKALLAANAVLADHDHPKRVVPFGKRVRDG